MATPQLRYIDHSRDILRGVAGLKQAKRVSWAPKRVSWAPDVKLCQIRLFLSEDSPSQAGAGPQDHLQAKTSLPLHSVNVAFDESAPPGFEAPQTAYQSNKEIPQISLIKWHTPLRFVLNREWLVVAGEESEEVGVQNQRQLGVLEAIYPRLSSIPPNPSALSKVQDSDHDDAQTPIVPITAIEEEETSDAPDSVASADSSILLQHPEILKSLVDAKTPHILPNIKFATEQSQGHAATVITNFPSSEKPAISFIPGAEPDIVAAASAAFTAIMRSSEEGSKIDRDLLIKLLSNPSLIEELVSQYGTAPRPSPPPVILTSVPPPAQISFSAPLHAPPIRQSNHPQNVIAPALTNPQPSPVVQIVAKPPVKSALVKDINYYKSLIQQHGGEMQEVQDPDSVQFSSQQNFRHNAMGRINVEPGIQALTQKDSKPKIPKPCVYFNSKRGCRHGDNCSYQHDVSLQQIDGQNRKRMKLDREFSRRS